MRIFLGLRSTCLTAATLTGAALLVLPVSANTEWPVFRGPGSNAAVSGSGVFEGLAQPAFEVAWRRPLGSGYSGVSVAGGRAVTIFSEGDSEVLVAFDARSGNELWRQKVGPKFSGYDGAHDGAIGTPALSADGVFILLPQGKLRAFEAASGKERWTVDLMADPGAEKPHYGYGSSPVLLGKHLLINHAISEKQLAEAFALADGARVFKAGNDRAGYQSPSLVELGGRRQVLVTGATKIYGLDDQTGAVFWEIVHEGDPSGQGAESAVPLVIPGDRVLLTPKADTTVLLGIRRDGDNFKAEKIWESKALGRTYSRPVYHEGHFYGYVGGFLTCVKAEDGSQVWRSRPPGDGFLLLLDGKLVVQNKQGSLHLADASPAGYSEFASLPLFADHSWTPPSFAGGLIYTRSMKEIAAVRLTDGKNARAAGSPALPADSAFGRFLADVGKAADPQKATDEFLAGKEPWPLVEGNWVHFLYRGDAQDVGILGDMIGQRVQAALTRVPGTDLFHYSKELKPGARVAYRFVRNLDEIVSDPRNPRQEMGPGPTRGAKPEPWSWVGVASYPLPAFLDGQPAVRGKIEQHELADAKNPEAAKRPIDVYLPPSYSPQGGPYPVLYVHGGADALDLGQLTDVFDRLQDQVAPFLAVFIKPAGGPRDPVNQGEAYLADLVGRVVPFVDATYRTRKDAASRVSFGCGFGGNAALEMAFRDPKTFGRVATLSAFHFEADSAELAGYAPAAAAGPQIAYFDWSTYDARAEHEGWDVGKANAKLAELLKAKGYSFAGGEQPDSASWGSMRARAGKYLPLIFPR